MTVLKKAGRDIARTYQVSSTWLPPKASAQTFADRVSKFGPYLPQRESKGWVSVLPRVHSRCDDPNVPTISHSYWVDESASTPDMHLQERQVECPESGLRCFSDTG